MTLSLCSLNVRGIRNITKRKAIFLFCKEQTKTQCFLLQETHSLDSDIAFWKTQWGSSNESFFSHGTSHSGGVAILFNRLEGKVIDHKSDVEGHWLSVILDLNDCNYIIVNVYGYNNRAKNKRMFSTLGTLIDEWKTTFATDKVLVTGDYNVTPDDWQDRAPPPSSLTTHSFNPLITEFSKALDLVDIWRIMNPGKKQFTWSNSAHSQCSRLDYFLISNNLVNFSSDCSICPSPLTDHCAIFLSITFNAGSSQCLFSTWKFNCNLLKNEIFCNRIKVMIQEVMQQDELSPLNKWEWLKYNVRKISIEEGKKTARSKRK